MWIGRGLSFTPSVDDWLPVDHLARFVVKIAEDLDTGELGRVSLGGTAEALSGSIRNVPGLRRFSMRELKKAEGERPRVCMAWKIRRMFAIKVA